MDKQDEALKLLKNIRHITRTIEELQMQIDATYTMLTNTTVKPKQIDVQTSLPADPMADKICTLIEFQETLQDYQSELINQKSVAIKIIRQMEIEKQQVLLLRYFKNYSIEEVGEKVGYTYRWAWEKIHQAEEDFISIYEKST